MHMKKIWTAAALFLAVLAWAENWPQWRGPRMDGTSTETAIPIRWSATENILWKTPIPGRGYSTAIICGDRIFATSAVESENQQLLMSLERTTGKVLWTQ